MDYESCRREMEKYFSDEQIDRLLKPHEEVYLEMNIYVEWSVAEAKVRIFLNKVSGGTFF